MGQIQLLAACGYPGMQPVHRIYHITQRADNALVMVADRLLLIQPVKIAAQQHIARIPFLRIAPYAHILIAQRKNRFRGAVALRIKALLNDRPGFHL
ncbi:hypothetical protein D3C73_1265840 [compost metagenome]